MGYGDEMMPVPPPRKNRIGVIGGPNGDAWMLTLDLGLCLHNGAFGEWEGQPATNELSVPMTIVVRSHACAAYRRCMRDCCGLNSLCWAGLASGR